MKIHEHTHDKLGYVAAYSMNCYDQLAKSNDVSSSRRLQSIPISGMKVDKAVPSEISSTAQRKVTLPVE